MPPDKGSSGNSGIITIAVAVIGAVALIVASYIQNQPGTHNDPPAHVTPSSNEPKVPATQSPVVTPPPQEGAGPSGVYVAPPPQKGGVVVGPPTAFMGTFRVGYAFRSGTDYDHVTVGNAMQCSQRCGAESRCRAITYGSDHVCWLKDGLTELQQASGYLSAVKITR
jgi:PAN domain